jgi:rare lipoprotein A
MMRARTRLGCVCALGLLVALSGCGTFSGRGSSPGRTDGARPPASSTGMPSGRGGYYLDDGPGANAPANLDDIPDAVPRLEAINRATSRPYTVMGRDYVPMSELAPYRARGMATWYGRRYHGKPTSSGEIYDMYAMTAAHTTLPIPSYARVTNPENGRSIVVRINDRGPFIGERLIDLSYVAAHKLDILRNGSGLVEVETVIASGQVALGAPPPAARTRPAPVNDAPLAETRATSDPALISAPSGHYLQLGAFSLRENAERFLERLRIQLDGLQTPLRIVASSGRFLIHAGPYQERAEATDAAAAMEALLGAAPILASPR